MARAIVIEFLGKDKSLGRTADGIAGKTSTLGSRLAKFGKVAAVGFAVAGAAAIKFGVDSAKALGRIEAINAQTEAAIESTGGAAGVSAKHVENLAGRIENLTAQEAEAVQEGANLLLTFTNIRNEAGKGNKIFDQATSIMTDMSVAMGTDLKSSAMLVGKALNDPIKGVTALTRAGVQLSDQQKTQIERFVESGETMKAQKIILGELTTQFGGSGKAFAATAQGQFALVQHRLGAIGETIVAKLMPHLVSFTGWILKDAIPAAERLATWLSQNLGPALLRMGEAVRGVTGWLRDHKGVIMAVGTALAALTAITAAHAAVLAVSAAGGLAAWLKATKPIVAVTKAWTAVQWAMNAALAANPIGLVIVALAALGAGLVVAYKKSATFRKVVHTAFAAVKAVASAVGSFFASKVPAFFTRAWSVIVSVTRRGAGAVQTVFVAIPKKIVSALAPLVNAITWPFRQGFKLARAVVTGDTQQIVALVKAIPGKLMALGAAFGEAGKALIGRFVDGMKNAAGIISGIAGNVWDTVRGLLNSAISRINAALEFTIKLPGPDITINPPDIPHLAKGGVVRARPGGTLALLGEAGHDEAVIPLSGPHAPRGGRVAAGGGDTFNIYLQSLDPSKAGQVVLDALRELQRATGKPLPIRVQTA